MQEIQGKPTCLDDTYHGVNYKYTWRCSKGHIWQATWNNIFRGKGCPYCAGKKTSINDLRQYAQNNNGFCLSKKYIDSYSKYEWKCDKNHKWESSWNSMKNGETWCPYCAGRGPVTIEDAVKLALKNNGTLLSKEYVNCESLLEWKCKNKHIWKASYSNVKRGTWCGECKNTNKKNIVYINTICLEKNGKCLSKEFKGMNSKYKFQCKLGHQWVTTASSIQQGTWCPSCNKSTYTINDLKNHAKSRGGLCLSNEYKNINTEYDWKCFCGYQWKRSWNGVLKQNTWCAKCAGNARGSIDEIKEIAKSKGGRCLTNTYTNARDKYEFICKENHKWKASACSIKRGSWCKKCYFESKKNVH